MNSGMVYFVGAGPGDIDLITVKGKRVLQQADVVIFDRLINPFLLTDVKDDAKLIYCGKQPCKHTLRQEDIQKEILIHAKKGKTVVRLKGGDPAVFGRVGEEAELLAEHQVDFEIIPGITAGIAATMYSGVPITHREHSKSFAVITGHGSRDDGTPDINWKHLAKGVETTVFYMGVKHLKTITTELIKNGKSIDTATLVVQWGTYSKQRTVVGTLATIANKVEQAKITNPAIILVGDVVKLRAKLAWFDNRALSGKSFLLPSQSKMNKKLVDGLKKQGADVFEHNLLSEHVPKQINWLEQIKRMTSEQQLILLSANSIFAFLKVLGENDLDLRDVQSPILAIDKDVQSELKMLGIRSSLVDDVPLSQPFLVGGDLEIEEVRADYPETTKKLILSTKRVCKKDLEAFSRLLEEQHVNTILFTNKEDVRHFLKFLELTTSAKEKVLEQVTIFCIGKETSHLLIEHDILIDHYVDIADVTRMIELYNEDELLAKGS